MEEKKRKQNGTGSVYPITRKTKGGHKETYRWGCCIRLIAPNDEVKKMYGNKLRWIKTFGSKERAEEACAEAIKNHDALLEEKLKKLGYYKNRI